MNDKRILVTAIGSFSAKCVINSLKEDHFWVLGTDIYPKHWHHISLSCDEFVKVPYATDPEYICCIIDLCIMHQIAYILPLTDLEIDIFDNAREKIELHGIKLLMPKRDVLKIARNKFELYKAFERHEFVKVPATIQIEDCVKRDINIAPCNIVAKPINGRSSEGIYFVSAGESIKFLLQKKDYILQERLMGNIYTVDYIRDVSGNDFSVCREELIRTKNGAGVTVRILSDGSLMKIVSEIGANLDIIGCVNMEFIKNRDTYYLIDVNPRFSAGIAFTQFVGYNLVRSHLSCHRGGGIATPILVEEQIIEKEYSEVLNWVAPKIY